MVANLVLPQPAAVGDEWGNALNVAVQSVNADVEALRARTISAGLGLTGGGDLTQNRSFAIDFAASGVVSATKAVRADDTRLSDARTPVAHTHVKANITDFAHTHAEADVTGLTAALGLKVPTSRTISPGSGLTGGGDLSANRSLTVDFATAAPLAVTGVAAVGTSIKAAREDHRHAEDEADAAVTVDSNASGANTRVYRRGRMVTLAFEAGPNIGWNNTWSLITIPVGYRPTRRIFFIAEASAGQAWLMQANTDGTVICASGTMPIAMAYGHATYPVA